MSQIITPLIILAALVPTIVVLRWKRDWVIVRICPREILMLDDPEERRRVNRLGVEALMRRGKTWLTIAGYILGLLVLVGLQGRLMFDSPRRVWAVPARQISIVLAIVIPMALIPTIALVHYRRWMRAFLREYLNEHGIAVCRSCGYDLRGQAHPRCPECGADSGLTNAAKG